LRIKDIDFAAAQITVREAKGGKDRVTMLPLNLSEPLRRHLLRVKAQHE
jgi:integrase